VTVPDKTDTHEFPQSSHWKNSSVAPAGLEESWYSSLMACLLAFESTGMSGSRRSWQNVVDRDREGSLSHCVELKQYAAVPAWVFRIHRDFDHNG